MEKGEGNEPPVVMENNSARVKAVSPNGLTRAYILSENVHTLAANYPEDPWVREHLIGYGCGHLLPW